MKSLLELTIKERTEYFLEAATRSGRFSSIIYEKDFWVCWTLKKLFKLESLKDHLTFKGGTSLSKVYNAIHRFSEDIDVSIHRSYFGFADEKDPENAKSSNERSRRLESLTTASADYIKLTVLPSLQKSFASEITDDFRLVIDEKDSQTILFYYPTELPFNPQNYISTAVKIEFGARSDNWPHQIGEIVPYINEVFSADMLEDVASAKIRVLTKARTFWEKVSILHAQYYRPIKSELPSRYSRHYYDMYCLSKGGDRNEIISDHVLLERVAQHKKIFFRSSWANIDTLKIGTLRLYPNEAQIKHLAKDYKSMQSMFFDSPPKFEDILVGIKELEEEINK
jgi:hypothetical protein